MDQKPFAALRKGRWHEFTGNKQPKLTSRTTRSPPMTNPMDRAVEAGAAVLATYEDPMEALDMHGLQEKAEALIRATFPILAEELDLDLALAEQFARTGDTTRLVAALGDARARIQQMTEAE